MKQTLFTLALTEIVLCAAITPVLAASAKTISYLNAYWAQAEIEATAEAGRVDSYPDGTFRPEASTLGRSSPI